MHKRIRRAPSDLSRFDTRRVLCKQHCPYCVKPTRARLKPSNALNAETIFSVASEPRKFGCNKSTVLGLAYTKTSAAGRSISAWSAMCRWGLGSRRQQGWPGERVALLAHGENNMGLKRNRRHLTGSLLMSEQGERRKRLLCGSRGHGLTQEGSFAGRGGAKCALGGTHIGMQRTLRASDKEARYTREQDISV